jgi:hypothetical protein
MIDHFCDNTREVVRLLAEEIQIVALIIHVEKTQTQLAAPGHPDQYERQKEQQSHSDPAPRQQPSRCGILQAGTQLTGREKGAVRRCNRCHWFLCRRSLGDDRLRAALVGQTHTANDHLIR